MDPDAKVQVPTKGTKLEYSLTASPTTFIRVYGLASTPDIGGQPNMIDTTTLDNTVAETAALGLQPASEISYEFNVEELVGNANANLRKIKELADAKTKAHWRLTKASGMIVEYDAIPTISYSADESGGLEKFVMYHDLKSELEVTLPVVA